MKHTKKSRAIVPLNSRIGTKLLIGYIPITVLSVLAVVILISTSRSWAAALAGTIYIAIWSVQVIITNFLIIILRFDRWFLAKALIVALASISLLPFIAVFNRKIEAFKIGRPDVPSYLEQASVSRCTMVEPEPKNMLIYYGEHSYGYEVNATIQCAGEERTRTCKWHFDYVNHKKQWEAWGLPLSMTCPTPQ